MFAVFADTVIEEEYDCPTKRNKTTK